MVKRVVEVRGARRNGSPFVTYDEGDLALARTPANEYEVKAGSHVVFRARYNGAPTGNPVFEPGDWIDELARIGGANRQGHETRREEMPPEDMRRTMEFIVAQQAQLTATVVTLAEAQARLTAMVGRLAEIVEAVTVKVDRNAENTAAVLAAVAIHDREIRETNERLNIFISAVERHVIGQSEDSETA